ncbi:MAG: hypothetical protein R6V54_03625 [Desulfobacteraceae bacterium]
MDLLVGGVEPVAGMGKAKPEVPAPQAAVELEFRPVRRIQPFDDLQPEVFQFCPKDLFTGQDDILSAILSGCPSVTDSEVII